ncbi:response regulator [bacterium]|nr:response regulator [bacterium]
MDTQKTCILIVDDIPQNLEILGNVLSPFYSVQVATSGKKALEIAQTFKGIEMILLDIMMPEMNGFEVCRKLKESAVTRKIPVIFVTAIDEVSNEEMGFDVGGVDYITKPISPPIVISRVKTHLALFNQKKELEEKVAERTIELSKTRDITIYCLSSLAETRDNETGDHIRRTQFYVLNFSRHLQDLEPFNHFLDNETVELLSKSAPLHDIGKVGIRDRILLKPGKLSPEEFEIMKTHTTIGRDTISKGELTVALDKTSSFLQFAREITYSHHEKWNGSGYPEGLEGDRIPLSGRIMAICDVYDALISRRVYKPPFRHEEAVKIIQNDRGKHFDPLMTDVFMKFEREFLEIAYKSTTLDEEKENLHRSL